MTPAEFIAKWLASTRNRACGVPGAFHRSLPSAGWADTEQRSLRRGLCVREGSDSRKVLRRTSPPALIPTALSN